MIRVYITIKQEHLERAVDAYTNDLLPIPYTCPVKWALADHFSALNPESIAMYTDYAVVDGQIYYPSKALEKAIQAHDYDRNDREVNTFRFGRYALHTWA